MSKNIVNKPKDMCENCFFWKKPHSDEIEGVCRHFKEKGPTDRDEVCLHYKRREPK